jgi:Mce-associated membrane protein
MTVGQESSPEQMEVPSSAVDSARSRRLAAIARWTRRCLPRWRLILAAALVTAAIGVPAGLFFVLYRPDRQVDDAAAHQAIQAASDGAVAVLSYSPANFDRDFANAKSHLTGDFLAYYDKFAGQFVRPMAQQKQITATTKVIRAAVSELQPDSAVVLVFIDQNTANKEKPEPLITKSSVLVTLTKVNGSWLIAKFDPVE